MLLTYNKIKKFYGYILQFQFYDLQAKKTFQISDHFFHRIFISAGHSFGCALCTRVASSALPSLGRIWREAMPYEGVHQKFWVKTASKKVNPSRVTLVDDTHTFDSKRSHLLTLQGLYRNFRKEQGIFKSACTE